MRTEVRLTCRYSKRGVCDHVQVPVRLDSLGKQGKKACRVVLHPSLCACFQGPKTAKRNQSILEWNSVKLQFRPSCPSKSRWYWANQTSALGGFRGSRFKSRQNRITWFENTFPVTHSPLTDTVDQLSPDSALPVSLVWMGLNLKFCSVFNPVIFILNFNEAKSRQKLITYK